MRVAPAGESQSCALAQGSGQLEVEGKAPAAVAPTFGLSANGVSALAMRAREGLRQAYLEEHVGANIPAACRTYATEFGAGARGRLSQRRRAAMQEHLGHCPACQDCSPNSPSSTAASARS
jgi:Putative zinc-finger